jgi:Vitamin B6 photo-protection and homoeostasis
MTTPSYTSVIATNYIGKDIIGQVGGLIFAWKTGKKADTEPLKYITQGGIILQASFFLENCTPFINNKLLIIPFLGISSTLKNISFISIGAVNVNNLQKLTLPGREVGGSIGDGYSKAASINCIASTLGLLCGIAVIHFIPSYTIRTIAILPLMSCISIYSLRKACNAACDHIDTR